MGEMVQATSPPPVAATVSADAAQSASILVARDVWVAVEVGKQVKPIVQGGA